eukprot:173935_1
MSSLLNKLFGSRQKQKYELQADQLVKLGYTDKEISIELLKLYAGDVNLVLEEYYDMHKNDAEICKEEGNTFMKQKKYQQAVDSYTKSIHLNPKNAVYYSNRAAAYIFLEDYKNAIIDSNISMQINPNYIKAYIRAGSARFKIGQYKKAYESYSKALTKLNMSDIDNYAYCLKKMKLCQAKMNSNLQSNDKMQIEK